MIYLEFILVIWFSVFYSLVYKIGMDFIYVLYIYIYKIIYFREYRDIFMLVK